MRPRLPALIRLRRPRIKAEWRRCMQCEVVTLPFSSRLLATMMDDSLNQLEALLRSRPAASWSTGRKTVVAEPLRPLCSCGLNPLLAYFTTGFEALEAAMSSTKSVTQDQLSAVREAWHFLAQGEIQALCDGCHRLCAPTLSFSLAEREL